MNANATKVEASAHERSLAWALPTLIVLGLLIRLVFIADQGFNVDVQTFIAWTISLVDHGLVNFYGQTSFVDYPPGYFYILAVIGHIWAPFRSLDSNYLYIRMLVKVPAILADLGVGVLLYAIARRFASINVALGTAALYILNPATIFISAKWGQVDSVAGGLALLAIYLLLKSDDSNGGGRRLTWQIPAAWIVFAYSLLIKPQAAVLIPVFIAFAFTDPARRRVRVLGTTAGIALAVLFSLALTIPFHPTANPIDAMSWLLERFAHGSTVYPMNSVNAFNLWVVLKDFWVRDDTPILFVPQYYWGIGLVIAAVGLTVWRYVTDRSKTGLLEASALCALAFFMLATRMHERYSFDGYMLTIACVPFARRYLYGAIALSVVLFANLIYAMQYLAAVNGQIPGANAFNLWGPVTHLFAAISVGTFFLLGWMYLGAAPESVPSSKDSPIVAEDESNPFFAWLNSARTAFDPSEGLTAMRMPLDYAIAAAIGVVSFVLSFVNYWLPNVTSMCWQMVGKQQCGVFDEIYFARAAEEYLRNMRIYENTHPPLSKLLVTLSVMLFGGLAHGDTTYGWRFLDVVFGAIVVVLLYVFAKRVTGSTLFAALASGFLLFDGMHFVQSRIATPEGFVVVFALAAVYAFYRFWIASQVEERRHLVVPGYAYGIAAGAALLFGAIVVAAWDAVWSHLPNPAQLDRPTTIVIWMYVALGVYLVARYAVFPALFTDGAVEQTFPDGSYALTRGDSRTLYLPDGTELSGTGKRSKSQYRDDTVTLTYSAEPSVVVETPAGSATYAGNEIRSGRARERGGSATLWLIVFTVSLGLLVSSKWYGVMGFGVSFMLLAFIWLQRFWRDGRPAMWGNPRGFRLDGALATILFISATVYALVWIPDLVRQSPDQGEVHNINNVVSRQYDMFHYHDTLVATHPYSSKWWEWPLDAVPIAYFYEDHRTNKNDPQGCCVEEITSLPNPFIMWFGLLAVPVVGILAWKQRNKAYFLIVLTYLMQWLPWIRSPRITFAYHFYVDIPLICLCNAIVLQKIYEWSKRQSPEIVWAGRIGLGAVTIAIIGAFVFFYPVLSAQHITWAAWNARMWFPKWIVGPG